MGECITQGGPGVLYDKTVSCTTAGDGTKQGGASVFRYQLRMQQGSKGPQRLSVEGFNVFLRTQNVGGGGVVGSSKE